MTRHFALVPAAGGGSRFGGEKPKQYQALLGEPLILHALRVLAADSRIERVFVILAPDDETWAAIAEDAPEGVEALYCGGATRAESVRNGLDAIQGIAAANDWVLVHDAARACLGPDDLASLIDTLADDPVGGILAVPVADTLKLADEASRVARTVPREGLWQAQTPQMFRIGTLHRALETDIAVTDEASAIEALGLQPRLVRGAPGNIKVTFPADMAMAALILESRGRKT